MPEFTDRHGHTWQPDCNAWTGRRLKRELNLDPFHLLTDQEATLARLADDVALCVDALWVLCEDQAKARGITDEDFGRGIDAERFAECQQSLVLALIDFTAPARRPALWALWNKVNNLQEEGTARAGRVIQSDATAAAMRQQMDKAEAAAASEIAKAIGV